MLNLQTNSKPQEIIKAYLEQNATQTLIDKINNGVIIEKNGKQLINRKTLDGSMKYASEEAKKLAETSSHSACVEDTVVFGWAMHYQCTTFRKTVLKRLYITQTERSIGKIPLHQKQKALFLKRNWSYQQRSIHSLI